jgi:hypothetical protein
VAFVPTGCALPLSVPCWQQRGTEDYFEEIRVFKAGDCLNTLAWDNRIRLESYFVGFEGLSND